MVKFSFVIFPILLFAISVYLAQKDFLLVVAFIFSLQVFLEFLLHKTIPEIGFASGIYIYLCILCIFVYYIALNPKILIKKYIYIYYIPVVFFFIYLYFLAISRGDNPAVYFDSVKWHFINFPLIIIFLSLRYHKYKSISLYVNIIIVVTAIQAGLSVFQYLSPEVSNLFKVLEYQKYGEEIDRVSGYFRDQTFVSGTLLSFTNVSSFLLLSVVFLCAVRFLGIVKYKVRIYLVAVLGITAIFMAGVRSPLVGLIVGVLLFVFYKSKFAFAWLVVAFIIMVPVVMGALEPVIEYAISTSGSQNVENPLYRLAGALALFDENAIMATPVGRSVVLLDYFFQSPIIGAGPGLLFSEQYSHTDAFLVLHLVEFGLFGFALWIWPYIYTLYLLKRRCTRKIYIAGVVVFLVAVSQSIVNQGLWAWFANIQFLFIVMVLFRLNGYAIRPLQGDSK